MEEIANNIYSEHCYPGVVLAVLKLKQGLLLVDAPFRSEDQQSWQAKLTELDARGDRLLVMLDTHIDRTLGIRAMETKVLGHENAVDILQKRSTTARGQDNEAGADWEPFNLPANIRWAVPDMSYSDKLSIYWDEEPIVLTHQPGSHLAGSWLWYHSEKVVFIGDSIVLDQPPFLAWSDLDHWLKDLTWLGSESFKGYKIISGRNGVVRPRSIEKMSDILTHLKDTIENLVEEPNPLEEIPKVVPQLLRKYHFDKDQTDLYRNRLIWGVERYIQRHFSNQSETNKGAGS